MSKFQYRGRTIYIDAHKAIFAHKLWVADITIDDGHPVQGDVPVAIACETAIRSQGAIPPRR
jgi:hypothetical protein